MLFEYGDLFSRYKQKQPRMMFADVLGQLDNLGMREAVTLELQCLRAEWDNRTCTTLVAVL